MKKAFEAFALLFRWLMVGIFSFIIVLPTLVSMTTEI